MANSLGINLETSLKNVIEKYSKRDKNRWSKKIEILQKRK
jgi:NTP pyrophosphatase (non-canonical NTP hydrolase)